jgi:hypothetical protein
MSDYARLAAEAKSRLVSNQVDAEIQKSKIDEESEFFERARTNIYSEIEEANRELARFELPPIAFADGWGEGHTLQLGLGSLRYVRVDFDPDASTIRTSLIGEPRVSDDIHDQSITFKFCSKGSRIVVFDSASRATSFTVNGESILFGEPVYLGSVQLARKIVEGLIRNEIA